MPKFLTKEQITSVANQIKTYIDTKFGKAVLFTPQTLADSEKAQARTNINTDKPSENKTASGDIASFADGSATPVKDLKATLDVVQPNKYDRPWPAGGGKNKFQVTAVTKAEGGVTFTINSDGTVKLSGSNTTSGNVTCILGIAELPAGTYTISSGVNGSATAVRLRVYNADTATSYFYVDGNEVNLTLSTTTRVALQIYVASGYAPTQTFYPMIRLATETDATFAPYSNICPIYPVTEVEVYRNGKNLIPSDFRKGYYNTSTWVSSNQTVSTDAKWFKAGQYTLSCSAVSGKVLYLGHMTAPTGVIIGTKVNIGTSRTFSIPEDGYWNIQFNFLADISDATVATMNSTCQVEIGATATAYEAPVVGAQYLVNIGINQWDEAWEVGNINNSTGATEASTEYIRSKNYSSIIGGASYLAKAPSADSLRVFWYDSTNTFIDSVSIPQNNSVVITAPSNAAYFKLKTYATTYGNNISVNYPSRFTEYYPYTGHTVYGGELDVTTGVLTARYGIIDMGDIAWGWSSTRMVGNITGMKIKGTAYCTAYQQVASYPTMLATNCSFWVSDTYARIELNDQAYNDGNTFKAAVAGQKMVFELATPLTIQLTPTEVQTLTGSNNLWADSGAVNVSYWTEGLIEADNLNAVLDSKKVVYASPHTYSTEDALQARLNIGASSNRNLLDNGWFTVNQRGEISGQTGSNNGIYWLDRWLISSNAGYASYSISNGTVTLTPASTGTAYISQKFENHTELVGKTLTASVMFDNGTIESGTIVRADGVRQSFFTTSYGIDVFINSANMFRISVLPNHTLAIKAVKLELGSVSTIANDFLNIQQELARCQRYDNEYINPTAGGYAVCSSMYSTTTYADFIIPLPVPMRATPTAKITGGASLFNTSQQYVAVTSITVIGIMNNLLYIRVNASGLTAGTEYRLTLNGSARLSISAEL